MAIAFQQEYVYVVQFFLNFLQNIISFDLWMPSQNIHILKIRINSIIIVHFNQKWNSKYHLHSLYPVKKNNEFVSIS